MTIKIFESHCPEIAKTAYVDDLAYVLGDVTIGEDSSIWPMAVLRGDIHSIRIGSQTNIQDGSVLHVTHDGAYSPGGYRLTLGSEITVGHRVILHGCTIGNRCLIGMGAVVMDGVTIQANTIVAAGSLVPSGRELEGGFLWKGAPARKARPLSTEELDFLGYSARHYVQLKDRHNSLGK